MAETQEHKVAAKHMPAIGARGMVGAFALFVAGVGASILWGIGGGLFAVGGFLVISCEVDEIVERFTRITRWPH